MCIHDILETKASIEGLIMFACYRQFLRVVYFGDVKILKAPPLPQISKLGVCLVWQPSQVEDPQYIPRPSPANQVKTKNFSCKSGENKNFIWESGERENRNKKLTSTLIPSTVVAGRLLWWFLSNCEKVKLERKEINFTSAMSRPIQIQIQTKFNPIKTQFVFTSAMSRPI